MKIVKFLGGLGNQMFQYAFYIAMKSNYPSTKADVSQFKNYTLHHGYELSHVFGIDVDQASKFHIDLYCNPNAKFIFRKLRRILGLKNSIYHEEHEFTYDEQLFYNSELKYYIGYWQNEQYFQPVREEIITAFNFKNLLRGLNKEYATYISSVESVAIHVRRGDYIDHPLLGNICTLSYYQQAICLIKGLVKSPFFFVFSNDASWCKENIKAENVVYVEGNTAENSFIDMHLMSLCKHQIIANSSFSWWAAWLNKNKNKVVIGPKNWINKELSKPVEIIPPTWISI